jgi:hypothetical protein
MILIQAALFFNGLNLTDINLKIFSMAKSKRQRPNNPTDKKDYKNLSESEQKDFDRGAENNQSRFSVRDIEDVDTRQEKDDDSISKIPPKGMDA